MKVAVAGASGLIGSALVRALVSDDHVAEVVAIDLVRPNAGSEKLRVVQRDIGDPSLARELSGIDAIVHLAYRDHDLDADVEASVSASRRLLGMAIDAGASTIVYGSSSVVYGGAPENPIGLREDAPLRGAPFAYPQVKVAIERMLDELGSSRPQLRIVRLRPSWVLAPGARVLLAGRAFVSLSDYDPLVQATWIDDVVPAFMSALHRPVTGAFNVGSAGAVPASGIASLLGVRSVRMPYRLRRALAAAAARMHRRGALHPGFVDLDRYPIVLDSTRAREQLDWQPDLDTAGAFAALREALSARALSR